MCENCEGCLGVKEILHNQIKFKIFRFKSLLMSYVCKVKGHRFKFLRQMKRLYLGQIVVLEACPCGESRLKYKNGREFEPSEITRFYNTLVFEALSTETNCFELLPKKLWSNE